MSPKQRLASIVALLLAAAALGTWWTWSSSPELERTPRSDISEPAAHTTPDPPEAVVTRSEPVAPTLVQQELPRRLLAVVDGQRAAVPEAEIVVERKIEELARGTRRRLANERGFLQLDAADTDDSSVLVSKEGFCAFIGWIGDLPTSLGSDGSEVRTVVLQSPRRLGVRVVDAFSGALVLDATVQALAPYGAEAERLEGGLSPQIQVTLCPFAKAPSGIAQLSIDPNRRYRLRAAAFGYMETKVEVLPGKSGATVFKRRWYASPEDEDKIAGTRQPTEGVLEPIVPPPPEPDGTITLPIRPILVGAFESPRVVANGIELPYGTGWYVTGMSPKTETSGCMDVGGHEAAWNLPSGFRDSITSQLESKIVGMRRLVWSVFVQTRPQCDSSQEVRWIARLADGSVEHQRLDVPLRNAATFTAGHVVRTGEVDIGSRPAELLVRLKGIDPGVVAPDAVKYLCEVVELEQRGFPHGPTSHRRVAGGEAEGGASEGFEEYLFLLSPGEYQVRASRKTGAFPSKDCVVEEGQRTTLDVQVSPSALQSIVLEVLDEHGLERRDYSGAMFIGHLLEFRRMASDPPFEIVVPPGRHFLLLGDANGCEGSGKTEFEVAAGTLRQKVTIRLRDQQEVK